jgi:hypothetical protein
MLQAIENLAWLLEPAVIILTAYAGYKIVTRKGKNA